MTFSKNLSTFTKHLNFRVSFHDNNFHDNNSIYILLKDNVNFDNVTVSRESLLNVLVLGRPDLHAPETPVESPVLDEFPSPVRSRVRGSWGLSSPESVYTEEDAGNKGVKSPRPSRLRGPLTTYLWGVPETRGPGNVTTTKTVSLVVEKRPRVNLN